MVNVRDLQEEARSLERAGRDAAAVALYDRILTDAAGAGLGGAWAARARLHLRSGAAAAAAADMAASAERYEASGLKNLALSQWRGALQADPEGPSEWWVRSARLAAAEGYLRDARREFEAYADRSEAAGRTVEAVQALRDYLAAVPGDASVRRRLAELTGEPEPAPLPPTQPEPAPGPIHAAADPLPGLVPTAADEAGPPAESGEAGGMPPPSIGLLDGFEPTATDGPDSTPDPEGSRNAAGEQAEEDLPAWDEDGAEPLPLLGTMDPDPTADAAALSPDPDPESEPLPLLGVDDPQESGAAAEPAGPDAATTLPSGPPAREYIDFGAMVMADTPADETRFQVAIGDPTGDEEGDFAEILDLFRRNVSERLDPRDAASHYDLGLAFKQMGLLDDAIIHLQSGLRGGADPLATLEVLGECFVLRGQVSLAARVFDRATRLDGVKEGGLVGVLYGLARCQEEMGEMDAARATLERVVSVDLSFRDAGERLRRLQGR